MLFRCTAEMRFHRYVFSFLTRVIEHRYRGIGERRFGRGHRIAIVGRQQAQGQYAVQLRGESRGKSSARLITAGGQRVDEFGIGGERFDCLLVGAEGNAYLLGQVVGEFLKGRADGGATLGVIAEQRTEYGVPDTQHQHEHGGRDGGARRLHQQPRDTARVVGKLHALHARLVPRTDRPLVDVGSVQARLP